MCLKMAPDPPDSAIASIPPRWILKKRNDGSPAVPSSPGMPSVEICASPSPVRIGKAGDIRNFGTLRVNAAYTMNIKDVAAQALQDALTYLKEIDPEVYARPIDLLFGATIGQHTRH